MSENDQKENEIEEIFANIKLTQGEEFGFMVKMWFALLVMRKTSTVCAKDTHKTVAFDSIDKLMTIMYNDLNASTVHYNAARLSEVKKMANVIYKKFNEQQK